MALPAAGGINLSCGWNNTGAMPEMRGPSVDDERCAGALYHYPAVTAHYCLRLGNITACCPGGAGCS